MRHSVLDTESISLFVLPAPTIAEYG